MHLYKGSSPISHPFDSRYSIEADPEDKEIAQFYYTYYQDKPGGILTFEEFLTTFQMPSRQKFLDDLENHHFTNSLAKKFGICCFSDLYNNHLLWSHYADHVKGVALVFDWKLKAKEGFCHFKGDKVKYRSSIIKKFYDATGNLEVTEILYSKYKDWAYENEIRELAYFDSGADDRAVRFDPESLVGIVLGAKISNENRRTISSLITQLGKYRLEIIDSRIDLSSHKISVSENTLGLK